MLFRQELIDYSIEINIVIDELLKAVKDNQTDEADILLIFNFAKFDEKLDEAPKVGFDHLVHAALEQAKFISEVRKSIVVDSEESLRAMDNTQGMRGIE